MKLFLNIQHYSSKGDTMTEELYLKDFEKIYEKTYESTLRYIISRCSDLDYVNDIMQETYFDLYKHLSKNKNIINVQSYLIGIANNKLKKYYSLKQSVMSISLFSRKDKNIEVIDTIKSDINLEDYIIKEENINMLRKFLKTKKMIIRKVFYLYYGFDMTIPEISKELKISESSTKNYLYRTLKEFQDIVRKESE